MDVDDRAPAGAGSADPTGPSLAVARLELLHALDRGILDGREIGSLLRDAMAALAAMVATDRVVLTEVHREAGVMKVVAESGIGGFRSPVVPLYRAVSEAWLAHPVAESYPDLSLAHDGIPDAATLLGNGTRSLARFPVANEGRLWLLIMTGREPRAWTSTEMQILQEVAAQVVIAVRQAQMMAALAEREARLRRILRQAANAMLVVDDDLRVEEVNPMAIGLLDRPPERLIGAPIADLLTLDGDRSIEAMVRVVQADLTDRGPGRSHPGSAMGGAEPVRVAAYVSRLASGLRGSVLVELARRDGGAPTER
jgi:GAF domain-containing protein